MAAKRKTKRKTTQRRHQKARVGVGRTQLGGSMRYRPKKGGALDIQKVLEKTGIEFHVPGYQYLGPGTHLKKRLARGDPGINRLDRIAKQHDIDYSKAKNLRDKWKADTKMIKAIDRLPGKKTKTERVIKRVMQAQKKLKL